MTAKFTCRVCQRSHAIGVASYFVWDRESYEPAVVRRDRNGGPNDMPSRADRNRLRRIAHVDLFAWLMHQRLP